MMRMWFDLTLLRRNVYYKDGVADLEFESCLMTGASE